MIAKDDDQAGMESCPEVIGPAYEKGTSEAYVAEFAIRLPFERRENNRRPIVQRLKAVYPALAQVYSRIAQYL
jgi:hypothetical protein